MALNTAGAYTLGDDYKVIKILGLPFGDFTLDCISNCMNELEIISYTAAADLVGLINSYETADTAKETADLAQTDGQKVLVKADVLEWEVQGGHGASGVNTQMMKYREQIANLFAFCSCLGGYLQQAGYGTTQTTLIRS